MQIGQSAPCLEITRAILTAYPRGHIYYVSMPGEHVSTVTYGSKFWCLVSELNSRAEIREDAAKLFKKEMWVLYSCQMVWKSGVSEGVLRRNLHTTLQCECIPLPCGFLCKPATMRMDTTYRKKIPVPSCSSNQSLAQAIIANLRGRGCFVWAAIPSPELS